MEPLARSHPTQRLWRYDRGWETRGGRGLWRSVYELAGCQCSVWPPPWSVVRERTSLRGSCGAVRRTGRYVCRGCTTLSLPTLSRVVSGRGRGLRHGAARDMRMAKCVGTIGSPFCSVTTYGRRVLQPMRE